MNINDPGPSYWLNRPLSQRQYLLAVTTVLAVKCVVGFLLLGLPAPENAINAIATIVLGQPLGAMMGEANLANWQLFMWLACSVGVILALVGLALRRTWDANLAPAISLLPVLPFVGVPISLLLFLAPSRPLTASVSAGPGRRLARWKWAFLAVAIGTATAVFSVSVGALLFGTYAYGMFVLTPFFIGLSAGYTAGRSESFDNDELIGIVALATLVGAATLVAVALEGIVCIVMAAPLGLLVIRVGAAIGKAIAQARRRSPANAFAGFFLIPLVFAFEHADQPNAGFNYDDEITIEAPREVVWEAVAHMGTIGEPPPFPFMLGIAYPLGADLNGKGVGAIRTGYFSTGQAKARVSVWDPPEVFGFHVLSEPPSMRELSPYEHVHAPHVSGYFTTENTTFRLDRLSDNSTRLRVHAHQKLRMAPFAYWLPMARWTLEQSYERVLRHIKLQAEARWQALPPQGAESAY